MNLSYNKIEQNGFVIFEFDGDYSGRIVIDDWNFNDVNFILNLPKGTYFTKIKLNPEVLYKDEAGCINMIVSHFVGRLTEVAMNG